MAQKPLKQSELASLLEANAKRLLETKSCNEVVLSDDSGSRGSGSASSSEDSASVHSISYLVNRHGARIFEQESISMSGKCPVEIFETSE